VAIFRRLALAGAASVVTTWSCPGGAKPASGIDLHWVAPARCPGADDVRARVRNLLGKDAAGASSGDRLLAEGTVVEVGGHYRLSLRIKVASEPTVRTRVFESASCDGVAGAAAVTLALLARGEGRAEGGVQSPPSGTSAPSSSGAQPDALPAPSTAAPPASSSATSPVTPPDAAPSASAPPEAAPAPAGPVEAPAASPPEKAPSPEDVAHDGNGAATATWSPVLRLPVLITDAGVLPSVGYGIGLGLGARVRQLRLMLSGVLWLSQDDGSKSPYAATYQRRTGELSGCYAWQYGKLEGGPCLIMTLEDVTADSTGPNLVDSQGHVSWLTMGLGAHVGFSPARLLTLFLRPSVSLTTSRPTFAIDGYGPLYKVPLAAVGVEVGSEWIF
jgi:hypothetical protein